MDTIKLKLIYPKWKKLPGQTTFNLPPHGPVAFAATLPEYVRIRYNAGVIQLELCLLFYSCAV